jgi:hypothetical protein
MAQPIFPTGYGPLRKVYSGFVPLKPHGHLVLDEDSEAFFYVKSIFRTIAVPNDEIFATPVTIEGEWSIQHRESELPGAPILFEQSVRWGAVVLGGRGGILGTWYPLEAKFKTRIVNGEHVPQAIEKQNPPLFDPHDGQPDRPDHVYLFDERQTRIKVKMPPLPDGAVSFTLRVANSGESAADTPCPEADSFIDVQANLQPGDVVSVDAAVCGATQIDTVWFRARAMAKPVKGENGKTVTHYYDGPAVRDIWTAVEGQSQVRGYEGWKFVDTSIRTAFSETTSYEINTTPAGGSFIVNVGCDWVSAPYQSGAPADSYIEVLADYWFSTTVEDNNFGYSFSSKPATGSAHAVDDPRTGETWYFFRDDGKLWVRSTRRDETFPLESVHDPRHEVYGNAVKLFRAMRVGAALYCVVDSAGQIRVRESYDEGRTWQDAMPQYIEDTRLVGAVMQGDTLLIYGVSLENARSDDHNDPEREIGQGAIVSVSVAVDAQTGLKRTPRRIVTGENLPTKNVAAILNTRNTLYMVSQSGPNIRAHRSTDAMGSFVEMPEPVKKPVKKG